MPQQFTVRLKNEPGALAEMAQQLADHGIDIRALSAGGVGNFGCAVFSTNNDVSAREILRKAKYAFVEGEVVNVSVEDQPGSLARLTRRLADAGVNVSGVLTLGRRQGKADLALSVDEDTLDKARRILHG